MGRVPGAAVEVKPLLDAIEAGENKLVAEADALVERVAARVGGAALDAAGAPEARRGPRGAASGPAEVAWTRSPQIAEAVAFAGRCRRSPTQAASLRARVLELLGAGRPRTRRPTGS